MKLLFLYMINLLTIFTIGIIKIDKIIPLNFNFSFFVYCFANFFTNLLIAINKYIIVISVVIKIIIIPLV